MPHTLVWSQNALSSDSFEDHWRAEAQDLGSNPWFTAWEIWRYFPAPWIKKFWPSNKHRIKIPVRHNLSALNPMNSHVEALEHGPVGCGSTSNQLVAPALEMWCHSSTVELVLFNDRIKMYLFKHRLICWKTFLDVYFKICHTNYSLYFLFHYLVRIEKEDYFWTWKHCKNNGFAMVFNEL